MVSFKDRTPDALKSMVVYQFTCSGCNSCYIGETSRHFSTRIKEHTVRDKNSHIFKHLLNFLHARACTHLPVIVFWTQRIALLILSLLYK